MAKFSLAGFKDPTRRPRFIIWTAVAVLVLAAFIVVAFVGTSSYWFCANGCHKVQDDLIETYELSSHSMVSCMSCHEPANADPLTFAFYKTKALLELWMTVTNTYELPLNAESHLALDSGHMGSQQCTQCHSPNRVVTPREGIIIDHAAHEENEVHCTACHNRIAHPEDDWEPKLIDPATGEKSHKHQDFMTMTACFRCHTLTGEAPEGGIAAPGGCASCHPADFELKPKTHAATDFYPRGHADLALEEIGGAEATGEAAEQDSSVEGTTTESSEGTETVSTTATAAETKPEAEEADSREDEKDDHVLDLVHVDDVNQCSTCHVVETFCMDCHGMEMPHSDEFKTKSHPDLVKTRFDKCELCHEPAKTSFCETCHHGTSVDWEFDPKVKWQAQHAKAVVARGVEPCLGACHEQSYCVECHTRLKPVPTSHAAKDWLHKGLTVTTYPDKPAEPTAVHAINAIASPDSCAVCHGSGGPNAPFCKTCHGMDVPHPETFKQTHVSGRKTPALCSNCHQQKQLCSDCHHQGAKNGVPWQNQHAKTVAKSGATPCFETCHDGKQFCVDCHTKLKPVPASHKAADWTKRAKIDAKAKHTAAYSAATDSCDYCHGEGGPKAKFCADCHKITMPHAAEFKDTHAEDFKAKKLTKAVCTNCHSQQYCDSCHHEGASATQPWRTFHPKVVEKVEAQACFECHAPEYCSYCHVRLRD
jgi:hypothetical protein